MEITRGKLLGAQKVVVYGPEGIGKSTFAAQFPNPIFIDTEGSTKHMDVARFPKPSSWNMLLEEVREANGNPAMCGTLVLDTADWAEQLCTAYVCAKAQKTGIEDFGYGKGYTYAAEEFGRLLNLLEEVVERGVNVVITAHAKMRKFEQPDEMGAYDRWEMKLSKFVEPLVKEWADMVLFANYKTFVITTEDKKKKAQGGNRVMYTTHHPCWDGKNRQELESELPFDYQKIAHCIPDRAKSVRGLESSATVQEQPTATSRPSTLPVKAGASVAVTVPPVEKGAEKAATPQGTDTGIPKALADLMMLNRVSPEEIQVVVAAKGYYPVDMQISGYDSEFIKGVLIGAWPQVFGMVEKLRDGQVGDVPF